MDTTTSLISLAISIIVIAGMWMSFQKAGEAGWKAIIPIYNVYIQTKIAEKPAWWLILGLIPLVRIVLDIPFAERYGKGVGFAVGLTLLAPIFYPILGFGSAQYRGRTASAT